MLDFNVTLFSLLVVASASTLVHAFVKYLAAPPAQRSLVYTMESLLLFFSIVDVAAETVTAYAHYTVPFERYRPVIYLQVLVFLSYVAALVAVKPNQDIFNIQIPLLADDNRKRIAFWALFAFASLLMFLWTITVSPYDHTLLILLMFPLLGLVGSLVEIADKTKPSTAYTCVVTALVPAFVVFKRIWEVYVK